MSVVPGEAVEQARGKRALGPSSGSPSTSGSVTWSKASPSLGPEPPRLENGGVLWQPLGLPPAPKLCGSSGRLLAWVQAGLGWK